MAVARQVSSPWHALLMEPASRSKSSPTTSTNVQRMDISTQSPLSLNRAGGPNVSTMAGALNVASQQTPFALTACTSTGAASGIDDSVRSPPLPFTTDLPLVVTPVLN